MIILLILLSIAVITDMISYKIPNLLILIGLVLGVGFRIYFEGVSGLKEAAVCMVLIMLFLVPLFLLRCIGAGDIKLFCMTTCFLSMQEAEKCLIGMLVIGAIMSLGQMVWQRSFRERMSYLKNYCIKSFLTKSIDSYEGTSKNKKNAIRLSIPVLISVGLHVGGLY